MKLLALATLALSMTAQAKPITGEVNALPAVDCGSDSLYVFSLEKSPDALDEQKLKDLVGVGKSIAPTSKASLRLEVCFRGVEETILKRVVSTLDPAKPQVFTVGEATLAKADGLSDALNGANYDRLELLVHDNDGAIRVRGSGRFTGSVVAVVEGEMKSGKFTLKSPATLAGVLAYGDVFANARCPIRQQFKTSSFDLGTATIEAEYCTRGDVGETTGYDILKMKVSDSSQNLRPQLRGAVVELEGDALKAALQFRFNHHNACDSFILRVDQLGAIYSATSPAAAGCGLVLEGAPPRKYNFDGENSRRSLFKNTYLNSGAPVVDEGERDKEGHYLRLW